jgi:hypothetical protein
MKGVTLLKHSNAMATIAVKDVEVARKCNILCLAHG